MTQPKPYIFVQAREGSTRLPNKWSLPFDVNVNLTDVVYLSIAEIGIPIVFVIPTGDEKLKKHLESHKIPVITGHANDLIHRFNWAIDKYKPSHFARLTADCPFISTACLSWMMQQAIRGYDYVTNTPGCVDGSDIQIVSARGWQWVDRHSTTSEDREHPFLILQNHDKREAFLKDHSMYFYHDPYNRCDLQTKTSVDTQDDYKYAVEFYHLKNEALHKWVTI